MGDTHRIQAEEDMEVLECKSCWYKQCWVKGFRRICCRDCRKDKIPLFRNIPNHNISLYVFFLCMYVWESVIQFSLLIKAFLLHHMCTCVAVDVTKTKSIPKTHGAIQHHNFLLEIFPISLNCIKTTCAAIKACVALQWYLHILC